MKTLYRALGALLCLACLAGALSGCGGGNASAEAVTLKFSTGASIEEIRSLNGKKVAITGYMATLSPISGKYIYLMNMPYQSCPYCIPNTTELANTMAVYAPNGKTFAYTDQAIRVTGTVQVGDNTDEFGYVSNYRIVNATCEIVDLANVSEQYALWQTIAADGVVAEINSMFDYLHFVSQWTEYTSSYVDENGVEVSYSLYPGDAENYLADTGPYGYAAKAAEGYFPGLVGRLRAISATELEDLVAIVEAAHGAEQAARAELANGNYSYDQEADCYHLTNSQALYDRWFELYTQFSNWLAKWEV